MTTLTLYEPTTGAITAVVDVPPHDVPIITQGNTRHYVMGAWDERVHFIHMGRPMRKISMPVTVELTPNHFILRGLPVPCIVSVDGMLYECDEDAIQINPDFGGTKQLMVMAPPRYLDWHGEVTL